MNHPRLKSGVTLKNLGDESILFDPVSRAAHVINRTAAEVCELCDGSRTPDDIARALAERYADAPPSVPADVAELLSTLGAQGLLDDAPAAEECPAAPGGSEA